MKSRICALLFLCLICGAAPFLVLHTAGRKESLRPAKRYSTSPQIVPTYGKLPLAFEVNNGQTDSRVKFLSRGRGYTLFLTGDEAVLALKRPSSARNPASTLRLGIGHPGRADSPAKDSPFDFAPDAGHLIPTGVEFKTISAPAGRCQHVNPDSKIQAVLRLSLVGANPKAGQ